MATAEDQKIKSLVSKDIELNLNEPEGIAKKTLPASAGLLWPVGALLGAAVITGYIIGHLRWSLLWCIFLALGSYSIINRRIERFFTYHRYAVERKMAQQKLDSHVESAEWLNLMAERLWTVLEPALSVRIAEKVNIVLQDSCPNFLDFLELTEFTLGSSAPVVLGAKVHPNTDPDVIHLDAELSFVPSEKDEDCSRPSSLAQWNSKIVLNARVGKGILAVDIPVMLKEIYFYGRLRVQLELAPTTPFISKAQVSFLELPKIDFILKPLKSFDLMDLPGLSNWLAGTINEALSNKLVNPNMITISLTRNYSDVRSIGILKVTLTQIRGVKFSGSSTAPFIKLQLGGRFRAISRPVDGENGTWDQTFYLLAPTLKGALVFVVMGTPTVMLGSVTFSLGDLELDAGSATNVWRTIVGHESSKIKGELNFAVEYFPAAETPDPEADVNFESGIAQITIHQLKNLVETTEKKALSCFYEVIIHPKHQHYSPKNPIPIDNAHYFRSKSKKKNNSPTWKEDFEVFLEHKDNTNVTIVVRHATKEDIILGYWTAPFSQLLNRTDWFHFSDTSVEEAQFYASFIFRPVRIDLADSTLVKIQPSLGVARIRVLSGTGLKTGRGGYHVNVDVNGRLVGKSRNSITETTPVWNKTFVTLIRDAKDVITLDVRYPGKGSGAIGSFISCGQVSIAVSELIAHQGYDIERNEPLEGAEDHKTMGNCRLRFTVGIYVIKRDDFGGTFYSETEPFDLIHPITGGVPSNCGVLELQSVSIKGILPTTGRSLHLVTLNINNEDPCFTSSPARLTFTEEVQEWKIFREIIVRNPEVAELTFTIKETQGGVQDDFVDGVTISQSQARSNQWLKLEGLTQGSLRFRAIYHHLPLLLEAEVAESGILHVRLLDASDLIAVDSGGTSDPFCVVRLNGQKVYKSAVIKKCLDPVFNENVEVPVRQRDVSVLQIELRDWNKVAASRTLGLTNVDVQNLPPDEWVKLDLPLENVSSGILRVKLCFVPEQTGKGPRRATGHLNVIAVPGPTMATNQSEQSFTSGSSALGAPSVEELSSVQLQVVPEFNDSPPSKSTGSTLSSKVENSNPTIKQLAGADRPRGSVLLTPATAAGLKITIVELQLDRPVDSPLEVKVKVRRENQTLFKTRPVSHVATIRWNEAFTLNPLTIDQRQVYKLLLVWPSKSITELELEPALLDAKDSTEQQLVIPVNGAGIKGRLFLKYALTMDTHNMLSNSTRRRRFSLLGLAK